MTTIQETYTALADGPLSAVGLHAFDHLPGESEWPAAYMVPPTVAYRGLGSTITEVKAEIVVLVSAVLEKKKRDLLAYQDHEGPRSIIAAVMADPSLGFPDVSVNVAKARPLHMTEQADYRAFGCLIELTIWIG